MRTRDRLNAGHALALRDLVSESHRFILWAHHSHVNNGYAATAVPSMGKNLLAAVGDGLYTIGLFAGEAEGIAVDDQARPPIAVKAIRSATEYGVERSLSRLADYDFLVDLSPAQGSPPECRRWIPPIERLTRRCRSSWQGTSTRPSSFTESIRRNRWRKWHAHCRAVRNVRKRARARKQGSRFTFWRSCYWTN
jgi:erythromycin esterase-like protein